MVETLEPAVERRPEPRKQAAGPEERGRTVEQPAGPRKQDPGAAGPHTALGTSPGAIPAPATLDGEVVPLAEEGQPDEAASGTGDAEPPPAAPPVATWRYQGAREEADQAYRRRFQIEEVPEPGLVNGVWAYPLPPLQRPTPWTT